MTRAARSLAAEARAPTLADVHIVGRVLTGALVLYIAAVAPLHGRRRYERLRARIAADPGARLRLYRRTPLRAVRRLFPNGDFVTEQILHHHVAQQSFLFDVADPFLGWNSKASGARGLFRNAAQAVGTLTRRLDKRGGIRVQQFGAKEDEIAETQPA